MTALIDLAAPRDLAPWAAPVLVFVACICALWPVALGVIGLLPGALGARGRKVLAIWRRTKRSS
ncbi:hypothetical protein [Agromyces neolithicus]